MTTAQQIAQALQQLKHSLTTLHRQIPRPAQPPRQTALQPLNPGHEKDFP
ncbi:hypothetical protein PS723_05923 [Pseudomonas fluorescens]|uniref:Uncharacterized protein n=1 Tax=Pseudomonas fluorescens TaxID=294 RepID=A0A5E7FSQ0_PSEFL|nr:hypothetical protein PS723_05923 [Pseudomonas fluorescens]